MYRFSLLLTLVALAGSQAYSQCNFNITSDANTGCHEVLSEIAWTDLVNVAIVNNQIVKITGGNNSWNAGGASIQEVGTGQAASLLIESVSGNKFFGLSPTNQNAGQSSISHAFNMQGNGGLRIFESGNNRGNFGTYQIGDTLTIQSTPTGVKYFRNGTLLYVSNLAPTNPLVIDVSIRNLNTSFGPIYIEGYTAGEFTANAINPGTNPTYAWMLNGIPVGGNSASLTVPIINPGDVITCQLTPGAGGCDPNPQTSNQITLNPRLSLNDGGFTISANPSAASCIFGREAVQWNASDFANAGLVDGTLTKTQGGNSWNAAAYSVNSVFDQGRLEIIVSQTNRNKIIGLSEANTGSGFNSVDYAFYLRANGVLQVVENGAQRGSFGNYVIGDTLRIQVSDGTVSYFSNDQLLWIAAASASPPLFADVSMNSLGATIEQVTISNLSSGSFSATTSNQGLAPAYEWFVNGISVGNNAPNYTNSGLSPGDVVECMITPDFGNCASSAYASNEIQILSNLNTTASDFFISTGSAAGSCTKTEERIVWDQNSIENIGIDNGNLEKIQGGNGWNAGAFSLNTVSENGYLEFVAAETNRSRIIGLSETNGGSGFGNIAYGLELRNNTQIRVVESGAFIGGLGNYASGDTFRIAMVNGRIEYYQNGSLLRLGPAVGNTPLHVDVSINQVGGTLANAVIANNSDGTFSVSASNAGIAPTFQWELNGSPVGSNSPSYANSNLTAGDELLCRITPDLVGCATPYESPVVTVIDNDLDIASDFHIASESGSSVCLEIGEEVIWDENSIQNLSLEDGGLTKMQGGDGWNAGATSFNSIGNNAYFEFIVDQTNRNRMIGLSNVDDGVNFNGIDYAFYLLANTQLRVYENGSNRGTFGNYALGDTLKIAVDAFVVNYYRNDVLVYQSGVSPLLPLIADVSIRSDNGIVERAFFYKRDGGMIQALSNNAGPNPQYQWYLNGAPVGSNSNTYSNATFISGDAVYCEIAPDLAHCAGQTYQSNTVFMRNLEPPTITCSGPIAQINDPGLCGASVVVNEITLGNTCPGIVVTNDFNAGGIDATDIFPVGTTEVVFTATDGEGNQDVCSVLVTVTDEESPVISLPDTLSINANPGLCEIADSDLPAPSIADNCEVDVVTNDAPASLPVGSTAVTYTATDIHGNSSTATFIVTVEDSEMPTITAPANISVGTDPDACFATLADLGAAIANDNCAVDYFEDDAPAQFPIGTTTVTYTVYDIHGNQSTTTQTVEVSDSQAPSVTAPADVTVAADDGLCTASSVSLGTPTADDNCGIANIVDNAPAVFAIGTTTVTYTATDIHGNTATAEQQVTVEDTQNPSIVAPDDVTVGSETGACGAAGIDIGSPSVDDNCTIASVSNNAPAFFPVGVTQVVHTVVDGSGNTAEAMQTVTVIDDIPPTITAPADMVLNVDENSCFASTDDLGTPTAADNCDILSTEHDAPAELPIGEHTVTYTVTDVNGNVSQDTQNITVIETIAPEIQCMADTTLYLPVDACIAAYEFDLPTATDNCEIDTVIQTEGPDSGTELSVGQTIFGFETFDTSGNTATCAYTVTVRDTIAPVFSDCQAELIVYLNESCESTLEFDIPNATDNCGATVSQVSGPENGENLAAGAYLIEFEALDPSLNTTLCSMAVLVVDTMAPVFDCPETLVTCDKFPTVPSPTASDNCAVIAFEQTSGPISGEEFEYGINEMVFEAIDAAGNASSCTVLVEVLNSAVSAGDDVVICSDEPVTLFGEAEAAAQSTWQIISGGGNLSDSGSSITVADGLDVGFTLVTWTVMFENGCGPVTDTLEIYREDTLIVDLGPDQKIELGDEVDLNASVNTPGGSYDWSQGSVLVCEDCTVPPSISPIANTRIGVLYTLPNGCFAEDEISVSIETVIPNILTPNGDGYNDAWELKFSHLYPDMEVTIYDRNGNQIFYSRGYNKPWRGNYSSETLSTAAFYYVINFNMENKGNATGVINLIK